MIRVLVVDDSATMRSMIGRVLGHDAGIEVVGKAASSTEAQALIRSLQPDVLTLDIEMPGMDGLEFLGRLMRLRPIPVVMVSMLTAKGAEKTLRALELGAVDCVAKPGMGEDFARLPDVVRAAAAANVRARPAASGRAGEMRPGSAAPSLPPLFEPNGRLVAIGASTGGVEALLAIISRFPANCPPTVITQHMPESFTRSFALRLDQCGAAHVAEAEDGAPLSPGQVYLAPGGSRHLAVAGSSGQWHCRLVEQGPVNGHRPSVDILFASVAKAAGTRGLGVILTGMGRDGASGLLAMRQAGARTFGQDAASSVVYGMPKVAHEMQAVDRQLPLGLLAGEILANCNAAQWEDH